MPLTVTTAIGAIVLIATITGREIDAPAPTRTPALQTLDKPSSISMKNNGPMPIKQTQKRAQKPLRTKLSQNR